jgi:hypothetical protein
MNLEPGVFARTNALRREAAGHLVEGNYSAAIRCDRQALDLLTSTVGSIDDKGPEWAPEVHQFAVLFSELALAHSMSGDLEQAEEPLRRAAALTEKAAKISADRRVMAVCQYGRPTLRPDGDCMRRPPCPK